MKIQAFPVLFLACLSFQIPAAYGAATELTIKDTSGVVRNVTQMEGTGSVTFNLTNAAGMPADGAEVTLVNELTGAKLTAVAANGTVVFDGVEAGVWIVSTSAADITFTGVLVTAGAAMAGTVGGASLGPVIAAVAGGSAVVAGAGAAVAKIDDDHKHELSPSS